jgi:protein-tyrosine phosphatase
VQSAGTRVTSGSTPCERAASLVLSADRESGSARTSKPRSLDLRLVQSADLILTAERSHRGAVARLMPEARPKTFTILEATQYAHLTAGELAAVDISSPYGVDRFRAWVKVLNSGRGRLPLVESTTRRRTFRKSTTDSLLDIEDGHNLTDRRHRATLDLVRESVTDLGATLKVELQSIA